MDYKYTLKDVKDAFDSLHVYFMVHNIAGLAEGIFSELEKELTKPDEKVLDLKNGRTLMTWGKYVGKTFAYIFKEHNQYLDYIVSLKDPKPNQLETIRAMEEFISALKAANYTVYQKKRRNHETLLPLDPKKVEALESFLGGSTVMTFGKWEDCSLAQIYLRSPSYITWLQENVNDTVQPGLRQKLEMFVQDLADHNYNISPKKRKVVSSNEEDDNMSGINIPDINGHL